MWEKICTETTIGCPLPPDDWLSTECTQWAFNVLLYTDLTWPLIILAIIMKNIMCSESSEELVLPKESIVFHQSFWRVIPLWALAGY
jgi:hypothetical protein